MNPTTGNLAVVDNEEAIKLSIRNLVLTNRFERPYQPLLGSKVNASLFEFNDMQGRDLLKSTVLEVIQNYEPRAQNTQVEVETSSDNQSVFVHVAFTTRNIPNPILFTITFNRVR